MIYNKTIVSETLSAFNKKLLGGDIVDDHIVFIQDVRQIWTHGTFYAVNELNTDDLNKINKLIITGNGDKFLSDNGSYLSISSISDNIVIDNTYSELNTNNKTIIGAINEINSKIDGNLLTQSDKNKLSIIKTDGSGDKYLSDDGTYKVASTVDVKNDPIPELGGVSIVNKILNHEDRLNGIDSSLATINSKLILATTTKNGFLSSTDKVKIDKIITNGNGNTFLANNGTYKAVGSVPITGYSIGSSNADIVATDTLNQALGKLMTRIKANETEIAYLKSELNGVSTALTSLEEVVK